MSVGKIVKFALETRSDSKIRASLSRGQSRQTQGYAMRYVIPLVSDERDEVVAMRIAALIANSRVPHNETVSFGAWCSRSAKRDSIENHIRRIHRLDMEQAVQEISRMIAINQHSKQGFNWYRLADLIYYWGEGITRGSQEQRQRMLRDFYQVSTSDTSAKELKDPA